MAEAQRAHADGSPFCCLTGLNRCVRHLLVRWGCSSLGSKKVLDTLARFEVMGPRARSLIGLTLSLIALGLAIKDVDLSAVVRTLARTNYGLVMLAFVAAMAATGATVLRWKLLLHPHPTRTARLFSTFMIGHLLNVVLPVKLGTVARAYLAGEAEHVSKAFVLGSIAVEKILDGLIIVLLGVILVPFVLLPEWLWHLAFGTGILFLALFLLMALLGRHRDRVMSWSEDLWARLPFRPHFDLCQQLGSILDSFVVLSRPDICWPLCGWSVVTWGAGILANQLTMMAMGIQVPYVAAIFLLVVLQLGTKLPSSPGNVGIFHYLAILSLSVFSVEKSLALSYGLVLHAVVVLLPSVLGAFCLWRESHSLVQVGLRGFEVRAGLMER